MSRRLQICVLVASLATAAFVTLSASVLATAPFSAFAVVFFFFFFARARRMDEGEAVIVEMAPRIETLSDRIKHGSIYRIGGGREDEMREEEEEL